MKKAVFCFIAILLLFVAPVFSQKKSPPLPANHLSVAAAIVRLETSIPEWMRQSDVQGLSVAIIRNGKLVWVHNFGVMNADTKQPVTDETIFEAASLTKVVTAYAALQLVDAGKLNLDTPLTKYIGSSYHSPNDPRINSITARLALSHSAGFPNWRPWGDSVLPINFPPGEKFSYSGEGFVYLAYVIEKITGKKFEDYVQEKVLTPIGMTHSSLVWLDRYANTHTFRHDWLGKVQGQPAYKKSNAAASLRTTATDYAKFILALLEGKGLKKATWQKMFTPQIRVDTVKAPQLAWGLGVGLETSPDGPWLWHWGDQGDSKCYFTANLPQKDAIVYFANSNNGLYFTQEILTEAVGGTHQALVWLDYERYDSTAGIFLQSVIDNGAASTLKNYNEQRGLGRATAFRENQVNRVGYKLLALKNIDAAILIFEQNTTDFPNSGNTWDSLAEAYMLKGNKELAIRYYEKSLKLNPDNNGAVENLKKLRQN